MFVEPKFATYNEAQQKIRQKFIEEHGYDLIRCDFFKKGIFYNSSSLSLLLERGTYKEFPNLNQLLVKKPDEWLHEYGIVDSPEQFCELYETRLTESEHGFIVELQDIFRCHQPPNGGFRYHKHGPYLGKQSLESEYLYDDEHINKVCLFGICVIDEKYMLELRLKNIVESSL